MRKGRFMPPKKQIFKEQIIDTALKMVQKDGYDLLTARKLAKELSCSTQPIYQAFANMSELKKELIKKAKETIVAYLLESNEKQLPKELQYIFSYIQFAKVEKHLFQLIFTSGELNIWNELNLSDIELDIHMIVYANGIIMMQAFQALPDSDEWLKEMLLQAYALLRSNK
ncbi:TetR/AcrR family transcriptional regulator [Candidatus Galacturonibacter soehngenii]|uniref:TetR/AcrR family transcriptional regulator n=2 Tax=Candidatus Galacturonatibacter soehngenii TaxID=2307010 RepID=A0A7V7QIU9_9FIRM|nr:TetR/AcrR family transcriptional regulator [Candidatus Galacturonibacter soehngenii]